jgi:hypothetical protein
MGANIPVWSKEVLGRAVTPQEFMADPKIQDAIFDKKFGDYVQKYGEENAAQAWFGGPGSIGMTDLKDPNGMDIGSYGQKYLAALGQAQGPVTDAPAGLAGAGGGAIDPATAPVADAAKTDRKETLASIGGNLGAAMGAPTQQTKSAPVDLLQPIGNMVGGDSMQIADTRAQDQLRNQLAQRMQLLSAGKLA